MDRMLKKVLGASKVIIFDHTIRRVEKAGEETPDTPDSRKPVAKVRFFSGVWVRKAELF